MIKDLSVLTATVLFFGFTAHASISRVDAYYGQDLSLKLTETSISSAQLNEVPNLKKTLFKVLSSYHIEQNGDYDIITDKCDDLNKCYIQGNLSYKQARIELYGHLYLETDSKDYMIRSVYCEKYYTNDDFPKGKGIGPNKAPDNNMMNVEHTWPQSKFSKEFPEQLQKADLMALFPVESKVNSDRLNLPFGEVTDSTNQTCAPSKKGHIAANARDLYFEPPDSHKGNVARALFYFSTRYKMSITKVEEDFLRRWHKLDPVDENEISRHEEIFKIQKVRNPYIDHPDLVDQVQDF